jgi:hypothetical protein
MSRHPAYCVLRLLIVAFAGFTTRASFAAPFAISLDKTT